jgi:hypothetical protein
MKPRADAEADHGRDGVRPAGLKIRQVCRRVRGSVPTVAVCDERLVPVPDLYAKACAHGLRHVQGRGALTRRDARLPAVLREPRGSVDVIVVAFPQVSVVRAKTASDRAGFLISHSICAPSRIRTCAHGSGDRLRKTLVIGPDLGKQLVARPVDRNGGSGGVSAATVTSSGAAQDGSSSWSASKRSSDEGRLLPSSLRKPT